MNDIQKVRVRLKSVIDGLQIHNEYDGEYRCTNGIHNIAYTDLTANTVTKNGIEATEEAMLLHRVGAFGGDMYFDMGTETIVNYSAFVLQKGFVLHTYEYRLTAYDDRIEIFVRYGLTDGSGEDAIRGEQNMEAIFISEENEI